MLEQRITHEWRAPSPDHSAADPTVTVIIPAYNVAEFIGDALSSVLAQTFTDFEVIIVDDGAPDGVEIERIVRQLADGRVRLIRQQNRGLAGARNTGLLAARARLVALLDADDWWEPTFLEEQVGFLNDNPDVQLVYTDAWIEGDPDAVGRRYMEFYPSVPTVTLESLLSRQSGVIPSAVVADRQAIMQAGMFDESLRVAEDLDLWLRLARRGTRMESRCTPLIRRRVHANNLGTDMLRMTMTVTQVLERIVQYGPLSSSEIAVLAAAQARVRSELALEMSKRKLVERDFAATVEYLRAIDPQHRNWKISAAIMALSLTPRLVHHAYVIRDRLVPD